MDSFQNKVFISIVTLIVFFAICCGSLSAAVVAVNAGGPSYTAADGTTYAADRYSSGGSTYSVANAISSTDDDTLYQSLRYGYGNDFSYNIPISNGTYDVTLKFAELYYDNVDDQVFSVSMERTEVISNLDILDHASKFEAHDVTISSVVIDDGELNITFSGANDASICAIAVNIAASQVNISADPFQIDLGGSSTLTWSSANADTVSIDNGIGIVAASGSVSVSPTVTTTYTITADGLGGTAQDSTTVVLNSPAPTVSISASPVYIGEGGTTTLSWSSTDATSANIDNSVGSVDPNGSIAVSPAGTGVVTYIITVTGPGGTGQDSVDVTVNPLPTVSITSDRTNITISESATLTWSSSDADTADVQPINSAALSGSQTVSPVVTTTYTITGTNAYGSKEDSVTIMVDQGPTVSISASPAVIVNGSASTLSWTADGADTVSIDQGIGTVAAEGSLSVTPTLDTTYTITVTNAYGTSSSNVTVYVSEPSTASITASPNPINAGDTTTLTWSSTNADSATINPTLGSVDVNGSMSVSLAVTTTYTLTVDGPGGVASHSVTVIVNALPTVNLSANPEYIGVGDSATLTWTSTNATTASIDQSIGTVAINGSTTVTPAVTTTYTITADGAGGTATDTATVTVYPIPAVNITSDFATINIGESATLTWTSSDAQTAIINAIGHVDLNSSVEVWPLVTTTYTITVEGYGGSASDSVTVSIASQMSVAVNCGGEAYTAIDGTNYVADTYYTGGNVYSTSNAIASSSDDELYQSLRYGYGSDFTYAIPLADWNYDITLKFAELYYDSAVEQVFSVTAEGTQVITDLDIFSQAGKYAAYDVTITSVNVSDGVLNLTFSGLDDASVCAIKVVPTPPTASISASPNPVVEGQTAVLSWNSTDGTAASIDQGIGEVTPNVYSTTGVSPVTATTYTITVDGPGGTATENVVLDVNNLPVVDISSEPAVITEGDSPELNWTTSYTDTISIDQGIGDVTGTTSYVVSPVTTTTYTITATNAYGSRTDSVTVTVNNLPVISSFEASANPITEGASTTLSWTVTGATSVSIDHGIGAVAVSGSTSVSPTSGTTYTLSATNANGTRTAAVTITVDALPTVSIAASPAAITQGGSSELSWVSAFAERGLSIDQGIGDVTGITEYTVSPTVTTTYTITASNDSGDRTDSVTVTVNELPVIDSFAVDSGTIIEETSATLSWTVTNADTVSLSQGIGEVSASGTLAVSPSVTTTYTLSAVNSYGSRSSNVTIIVNELPTVSISALPSSISEGESTTLSWHTTNTDSASIEGIGDVTGTTSTVVSPVTTTTYTITATNTYGSRTDSVTVLVDNPPTIDSYTLSVATIVEGGSAILSWSSTGAEFANINNGIGSVALSGSATVYPVITTTYTLTVTNTYGSDSSSLTVAVNNLPQASITADPDTITQGESSTLSWTTSGAVSASIDQGIGTVTENIPGSQSVTPSVTTTYTITAVNSYGSVTDSATITVNALPTVSIDADATSICEGDSATLSWSSTGADTITINQGIGSVAASGSGSVSPAYDTTYTITAISAYGSASQTVTITVSPLPSAAISASADTINSGETTTLSWSSSDAVSVSIDQGIGTVSESGTTDVSPTVTTTYTVTATNTCGDVTDSVIVTVYNTPTVDISAASSTIDEGASTTLTWTSAYATSASIDQGIGGVNVNGSTTVSPTVTTTYTITVTGPAGTNTDSTTVSVNLLPVITSFAASPTNIASGGSSTLSWTTTGETSLSIDQSIGDVTGSTSTSVSPTATTTYTLTATNTAGSRQKSVTVVIDGDAPVIDSFSADPEAVVSGNSSTLSWWVSGAESISIDNLIGTVSSTGTVSVTPGETTTYTITATNTNGTDTETVTVTVGAVPTITLSASPTAITEGESSTLTWTSTDATLVEIDQGIGSVTTSGSQSVSPVVTTTYTATASSQFGTATSSATVTVNNLPVINTFAAEPAAIVEGGSATLSWTTTGAGYVELDQGIGIVGMNSSTTVSPVVTTVYTLTATNTFGSITAEVTVTVHNLPTASISSDPTTITDDETATLTWSTTNAANISIDHGIGAVAASGTTAVTPEVTTTYTITATNAYGSDSETVTITVNTLPVASISATPTTITQGGSSTLYWNATNADSASIDQSIGTVELYGYLAVTPTVTTTYTITATNTSGSRTASVTVNVGIVPAVSLSATPAAITEGTFATLDWSSTDATTVNIDHGIGTVAASGTTSVSPAVTTTYTAVAANAYGTASISVTVTVNNLPAASIAASPETITDGSASILNWISSNSDSVSIDQGIGAVIANTMGSQSVTPDATVTYTITATNTNGEVTDSVTVTVNELPVIDSFEVDTATITEGDSVTLSWDTTDATSVSIDHGIGSVDLSGTMSASPVFTTTYTLTAANAYGTVTSSVTVTVNNLPIVGISADPATITEGESTTLEWTTSYTDSISIDNGIGVVTGTSYTVSPVVTTVYTITATNSYDSRTDSVTVTVNALPVINSFTASPTSIIDGDEATLSWETTLADMVSINQGIGSVTPNVASTTGVAPALDTTYTIIATNAYGTATDSVTIAVSAQPLPEVSISASPNPILSGEESILRWLSSNATTLGIEPDLGLGELEPDVASTTGVSPTETTTYTITATNQYGSASESVTVVVGQLPFASISATEETITEGETTTLIWDSINAETCTIDQGVDTGDAVSGAVDVNPAVTTTYTVTATHTINGSTTASVTVTVNPLPTIDTFTATPATINNGGTSTLSWTATNADSASIDKGVGTVAVSGTIDVSPLMTTTYTITALNAYGTRTANVTVTVTQLPVVNISASPVEITAGDSSTLSWTASNADSVTIDQEIGTVANSGSLSVSPAATTTYTITASNYYGSVTASVTITVGDVPVIEAFAADPASIIQGGSSTLSWTVTGADTLSINQGIGDVTGTTQQTVSPVATTTYTLSAANAYGSVTSSVTVTVGQLPSVDISASPDTITEGGTATLSWTSINAESCSIDQGIGTVLLSGSTGVTPILTTTYTITATNTSGTATDSVTVTVNSMPVVSIIADPETIIKGESSTLTWTSTDADSVSLSNGIGSVDLNGSTSVSPSFTTTYTVTATNAYGSVASTATVTVYDVPTVNLDADPANIITGALTTLTWTSSDATDASIDQGIGTVAVSDSLSISPAVTTTYTITVSGPGGTATDSVTVGVHDSIAANITASPEAIVSGEQSVLFWNSTGSSSISIDGGIGEVAPEGWKNVSPAVTTTYTITAIGVSGVVTDSATITVSQGPTVSISATPETINEGGSSVLSWTSSDADTASINNGIGAVEVNGSVSVTPSVTTMYTITVNGEGGSATSSVTVTVNSLPTVSIQASPASIAAGGSSTLSWTSTSADTLSIDQSIGDVTGTTSLSVAPEVTTTYTITATNAYGTAESSATVTVYPAPTVTMSADSSEITEGASATLTWTSTDAASASINQGIGSVAVNGSTTVSPAVTTTYTITVTGSGGTAEDSVAITVNQLPNVSISASPNNIASAASSTLSWSSSNATSVSIDQGVDTLGALSGSASVSPTVTTTYTATATNDYGSTTDSVTIMVEEPPVVSMSASPSEIAAGSQSTLSWSSSGADSVSINQSIGAVALDGTSAVTPAITTTYTVTAVNTYGTVTDSATVTVYPVPTVNLTASPTAINIGQSSALTWTSTDSTSASIDSGIGAVAVSGSMSVAPTVTTTYTITVTGSGGTATDSITVNVNQGPSVSITADPSEMGPGGTSTLTWTSTSAISASIDQGIGEVSVSGSTTVTPSVTTTYTITVEGPGGSVTDSATITITDELSVSISASASSISLSESTTLTWTSANASTAIIDQGIGAVPVNGSIVVTPASTRTYTITVEGPAGTATASVEVVVYQPPEVTITADPERIIKGDSSTLTWTSVNANTVTIDQEIGAVVLNGTMDVYPEHTTTYTITAQGDWTIDVATDSATVGVVPREAAYIPTYSIVPGGYSYNITVIDLEVPVVAYTIDDVGNQPMGIVPDSTLDNIYVTCLRDQTVEKIDVFLGEKITAIDVGPDLPRDIAIAPDGSTVYVSMHNAGYTGGENLPVIDTATDTIIATASMSNDTKAIDVSPDGTRLYASSVYGSRSDDQTFYVSIFDTADIEGAPLEIDVDPYHPFDLVASPDGSRVYLANLEEGLSYIDTSDNSFEGPVLAESDKQYIRLEVSPDGAYIFAVTLNVSACLCGITAIDASTLLPVGSLYITGPGEWLSFNGIDIHPTRDELYLVYSDTASLGLPDFYVIDISDPSAMTVKSSLTIGRHDDIYGELLIIRP